MFVSPCSTLRHGRVATPGFIRLSDTGCRRFRRIFGGGDERLIGRRFFFFFSPPSISGRLDFFRFGDGKWTRAEDGCDFFSLEFFSLAGEFCISCI